VTVLFLENVIFGMFRPVLGHDRGHQSHTTRGCFQQLDSPQWARVSPIIKASRSHSDTPLSVGILWTSDELVAQTSRKTQNPHTGGIRTRNPSKTATTDPRLRPPGQKHTELPLVSKTVFYLKRNKYTRVLLSP